MFTLQTWKDGADEQLGKFGGLLGRLKQAYAPYLLYGTLCSLSLWPLVEASQKGETLGVMTALGGVAAGVGGNLLAEQVQRWKDGADQEAVAEWVVERAPADPELRGTLDAILEEMGSINRAQGELDGADRVWFGDRLRQELSQLGNLARFEATLIGSGAIAQDGGRAVGQAGALVEGDVHGDVVTGTKTTVFDQRGQKVKRQVNIAGDRVDGDVPDAGDETKK